MTGRELGPIDRATWPERLTARVVDRGSPVRILGFAVGDDLAPNYGFHEWLFLLSTGRLPDGDEARTFDIALRFAVVGSAGDAAPHAASLARLSGAAPKNVIAIAAALTAEWAAEVCGPPMLEWLSKPGGELPGEARSDTADPLVETLRSLLPKRHSEHRVFAEQPTLAAAIVSILHATGVERAESLVLVLTLSRLSLNASEALATVPLEFRDYAMQLPRFEYAEEKK